MRTEPPNAAPAARPPVGPLLFLLALLAAAGVWFAAANLFLPHPLYEFEAADAFGPLLLREGVNPYGLASHPVHLYSYGIVQPLVALPLAVLFPSAPAFLAPRAVSCLSLVAAAAVLFWAIRLSGGRWTFAWAGALLLFVHHAFGVSITGKPGGLGMLFYLLGAVLPAAGGFRRAAVWGGMACAVLGFYTKPYFVLIGPALAAYLFLFRSKREGLEAAGILGILFLGSAFLVDALLPLYFTDTVFVLANFGRDNASAAHLAQTLWLFAKRDFGLLLVVAWGVGRGLCAERPARPRLDWARGSRPLVEGFLPSFPLVLLASVGAVYLVSLGLNRGGGTDYLYQLVLPFLIWEAAAIASRESRTRWDAWLPALSFLAVAVLLAGVTVPKRVFPFVEGRERQAATWRRVEAMIASHREVLADLYFGIGLYDAGRPVDSGGQTPFYPYSFLRNPFAARLGYAEHCRQWRETLARKLRDRRFDLVLASETDPSVAPPDLLALHYRKVETFLLPMTFVTARVGVWEPKAASFPTP